MIAVAAALRLAAIDLDPFWLDEATTAVISRRGLVDLVLQRAGNGHPPLFFLVTWLIAHLGGTGEVAMRLPAVLAGVACVPVLYLLVRRLAGPRPALLAAALLAVSPTHLELSLMARGSTLAALAALAASLLLAEDDAGDPAGEASAPSTAPAAPTPWRRVAGFAALDLVALGVHVSSLLVVVVHAAWALRRRRWRHAAAAAAVAATMVPWFAVGAVFGHRPTAPLRWIPPFHATSVPELTAHLAVDLDGWGLLDTWLGEPAAAAAGWAVVLALVALAAAGAAAARGAARLLAGLWLGPPLLGLALVAAGGPDVLHEARYFLVSSIAFIALLALGAWTLPRRRRNVAAGLTAAALIAGCGLELAQPAGTDWRTVARVLAAEARPGEELLVLPDEPFRLTTLRYYYPGPYRRLGERQWRDDAPPGVWVAWSPGAFAAARRRNPAAAAAAERELRRLERRLPERHEIPLRSGTLLHLTRPPTPDASTRRP